MFTCECVCCICAHVCAYIWSLNATAGVEGEQAHTSVMQQPEGEWVCKHQRGSCWMTSLAGEADRSKWLWGPPKARAQRVWLQGQRSPSQLCMHVHVRVFVCVQHTVASVMLKPQVVCPDNSSWGDWDQWVVAGQTQGLRELPEGHTSSTNVCASSLIDPHPTPLQRGVEWHPSV